MVPTSRRWLLMLAFIFAFAAAPQDRPSETRTVRVTIEREGTKPTGSIVFWHLQGSGAVCSADADSAFGSLLRTFEHAGPVVVTIAPVKPLERLSR